MTFQSKVLPKSSDVIKVRRKDRGIRNEREVVVTGTGRDGFLGFFVGNNVIEQHFKPSEFEWTLSN